MKIYNLVIPRNASSLFYNKDGTIYHGLDVRMPRHISHNTKSIQIDHSIEFKDIKTIPFFLGSLWNDKEI